MATIKSYTDLEQSKKLAEILPLESADMHYPDYYFDGNAKGPCNTPYKEAIEDLFHVYINPKTKRLLPCWSLAALLGILPVTVRLLKDGNISNIGDAKYSCECSMVNIHKWFDNPIDACIELILKLHEREML